MVHVEPESYETDNVDNRSPDLLECDLNEHRSGNGRNDLTLILVMVAADFGELHLGPELNHVDSQEGEDYDTENKHVLR